MDEKEIPPLDDKTRQRYLKMIDELELDLTPEDIQKIIARIEEKEK